MKKYSQINQDDINEGMLRDFLKLTKDKYFTDTFFIKPEDFNYVKYSFTESLIRLLKSRGKFPTFSKKGFSKAIFDPKKVLGLMLDDLMKILEKQKTSKYKETGLSSFNFNIYYNENKKESLLSHCLKVMEDVENWLNKHYITYLERVYSIENNKEHKGVQDYEKIKQMSLELFKTLFEIKEKKINFSLDSWSPRSKYEKIAKDIMNNFKSQGVDIEYSFIGDPRTFVTKDTKETVIIPMGVKKKEEEPRPIQTITYNDEVEKEVISKDQSKPEILIDNNGYDLTKHKNYNRITNEIDKKISKMITDLGGTYEDFDLYNTDGSFITVYNKMVDDNLGAVVNMVSKNKKISPEEILNEIDFKTTSGNIEWGYLPFDKLIKDILQDVKPIIKK
jgi:hypothetical protein